MGLTTSAGVIVPGGYEVARLAEDRAILYAPEDVRDPETGAYLGRRKVAEYDPRLPSVELDVGEIAELDSMIQAEDPEDPAGSARRAVLAGELAGIFSIWRHRRREDYSPASLTGTF